MSLLLLCLLALDPVKDAEDDISRFDNADALYVRYLYFENVEKKDDYLNVVSFILNSISNKKRIVKPVFVGKSVMRFDLRDYGIKPEYYGKLPVDPYTKNFNFKLNHYTGFNNSLMRVEWFIVKAMNSPDYYRLLGVSNLKEFRKRHGDDGSAKTVRAEQAAIISRGMVARNSSYVKRIPTPCGSLWEAREIGPSQDYLKDLLSEEYDLIQFLAFNPNGLLSYCVADNKGKLLDYLPPEVAIDKNFDNDALITTARSCVACHVTGIMPVDDTIRNIFKNSNVRFCTYKKEVIERLEDLFGDELPITADQDVYKKALMAATGMDGPAFTKKFLTVWRDYYKDLNLDQAAKESGKSVEKFTKECRLSLDVRLVNLFVNGKISRVQFEDVLRNR